ncbi:MAG TPA: VOC family protein [Gaiellaceae bacterium]|nr:VOC family protein [Gaiellaceae bacterium]
MRPQRVDHVALLVPDPERIGERLRARLPLRVLERTEEFVLLGRAPERGKITLVRAEGSREAGPLVRLAIGVPCAAAASRLDLDLPLEVSLVPAPAEGEVDLDHLALAVPDPAASMRAWRDLGFAAEAPADGAARVRLGSFALELHPGSPEPARRPLLGHLGLLVESAEQARREAEAGGLTVTRTVDAELSRAVFVQGPDGVEVELVEHKPAFALV